MGLSPTRFIRKVELRATHLLAPNEITLESVGEKAFGLCCLPTAWSLPFIVISCELLSFYKVATNKNDKENIVSEIAHQARKALDTEGLPLTGSMIVRSSAVSESLEDRGKYHTTLGKFEALELALLDCLASLSTDKELANEQVHLILQQAIAPIAAKGHLSNERRCYEEARDWLGELEGGSASPFTINLRRWRQESNDTKLEPLTCHLMALISKTLTTPAWWAYRLGIRIHFEWVWDGRRIYIVQADEAKKLAGVTPILPLNAPSPSLATFKPKCLKEISQTHASKYNKIKNVYAYLALKLPITKIYVLDEPSVFAAIRSGSPPSDLLADLASLVSASLVIRTDLATDKLELRQLLPRTNEVRDVTSAINFLKETLDKLSSHVTDPIAFILHNFIPSTSAAFAYAAPGQRKVLIESLWGLPEGLYYNSHDKFEVDTTMSQLLNQGAGVMEKFRVLKKPRFKRNFVAPDESGNWVNKVVSEPWDWRPSIQKDSWIKKIAFDSKRIAEQEDQSVSIMWFVGVPCWASPTPTIPWYHEPFDFSLVRKHGTSKQKTPFDRSLVIKTKADIASLENETKKSRSLVRQVRIRPQEDDLLRNKELLKNIGELTKKIGAVILLEGGTLSHAYYQLAQSQAVVEVLNPFDAKEEKREFNKLVRDYIPSKIQQGGEAVRVAKLAGDQLLRVLREKLIEESFEALEAADHEAIVDELADVEEVIEAILVELRIKRTQLRDRQKIKYNKAGGFTEGYVLLETNNPTPTPENKNNLSLALNFETELHAGLPNISLSAIQPPSPILAKWSDRREHGSASERIISLVVSLVSDSWTIESPDITLGDSHRDTLRARLHGQRDGANLHLELSIFTTSQLSLFNDEK
ncbi:MAG: nucleoside triphosphate pyrophosphohydrolase [Betaproteobacteria bacterium]|nr:nucleoside triphosphate pyrophosphohydrolase [Betaproteobacteria bacterium]